MNRLRTVPPPRNPPRASPRDPTHPATFSRAFFSVTPPRGTKRRGVPVLTSERPPHASQAKIERDQRNGLAPPAYARPRASFQSHAARKPVGGGSAAPRASSSSPPPGGGSYQIKEGDTLYRIALNHGVDPDVLQAMNPELAGRAHAIQVGEYVRVPRS